MSITNDQNGNKSSKRITGISLLSGGGCMALTLFIFSLFKKVGDSETAIKVIQMILIAGSGLLGIGVVEFFGKKKG